MLLELRGDRRYWGRWGALLESAAGEASLLGLELAWKSGLLWLQLLSGEASLLRLLERRTLAGEARRLRREARLAELLLLGWLILLRKACLERVLVPSRSLAPVRHYRVLGRGRDSRLSV